MKVISIILAAFLLAIQAQLWLGKGSLPRGVELRDVLTKAQAENELAKQRNAQLEAELRDLREGLEMVEEKARFELGMIKPDEIFVQIRR
ncbi:septum formation initiator family protein [Roseateles sp.]|uniref:septum formation initiator family protein n=1 Tax=Roseateles sp. TaxID=1971397 RepID=UPI00286A6146|nr:septum formation initiator family protein [Roseateles sp.]